MTTADPLVLLTADMREDQGFRWHAVISTYVAAVADVTGATVLIVPAIAQSDPRGLLEIADGIVATGSRTNVHPSQYGAAPTPDYEPYDIDRDTMSLPLLRAAVDCGVPLLAICRGMQELNVALGGSLETEIQRRDGRLDHRAPEGHDHDRRYAMRHEIDLVEEGSLARVMGRSRIEINSLHRQAIADLAPSLIVEARAPDGVIEAVRGETGGFVLGVQWHPEYWAYADDPSRRLFAHFGDIVRTYRDQRLGLGDRGARMSR